MSTPTLDVRRDGHVARVYLNRPDVRNAFNDGVIAELTQTFAGLGADASLRCIVLGGHGKAFCAGADLNWMRAMAGYSWDENRADAQALADMLWTIYSCPVPVVGRIHGDCYAGGLGLAAVCDVLVASEGVNFCLSEAKLGLLPATIGPYVVRAMGEQAARRWFITAERFSAAQARAMGFVHECVAPEALDAKVDELDDSETLGTATLALGHIDDCMRITEEGLQILGLPLPVSERQLVTDVLRNVVTQGAYRIRARFAGPSGEHFPSLTWLEPSIPPDLQREATGLLAAAAAVSTNRYSISVLRNAERQDFLLISRNAVSAPGSLALRPLRRLPRPWVNGA